MMGLQQEQRERLIWIDQMRGLAMAAILYYHLDIYFTNLQPSLAYNTYAPNALMAFFFLSGYLQGPERPLRKRLANITGSLLLPYFVFTLLTAIPKAINKGSGIVDMLSDVLLGNASWFVAALIVAELLFALLQRCRSMWLFHLLPFMAILVAWWLTGRLESEYNIWKFHNGLIGLFFMYLGHVYRQYQHRLTFLDRPAIVLLAFVILLNLKVWASINNENYCVEPIMISCYPTFLMDMILGIVVMMAFCKRLPDIRVLTFVGKRSLIYYFFSGAVPRMVVYALSLVGFTFQGKVLYTLLAFIPTLALASLVAWLLHPLYLRLKRLTVDRLCHATLMLLVISCFSSAQAQNDTIPVIHIRTDATLGNDYQSAEFILQDVTYPIKIRWRGASTNLDNKHKRNYRLKFAENYSFLGLRSDDSWILDAGQADVFRLRNLIAAEIWQDFARKPYYSDIEPSARSATRGHVVEVYLNNQYEGIYSFIEPVDRKQMKLKKYDTKDGLIRGCLWKSTNFGASMMWDAPDTYDNSLPAWEYFEAKYPEPGSDAPETEYGPLFRAIHFVMESSDEEFVEKVDQYFDLPVLEDFFIYMNVMNALDNRGKNMIWAVYNQQIDERLTLAMWDLDCTVGQPWLKYIYEEFVATDFYVGNTNVQLIDRLLKTNAHNFCQQVIERYEQARAGVLSTEKLCARYRAYNDLLQQSGAAQREQERWSGDTDIHQEVLDFASETEYICEWLNLHLQFLDRQLMDNMTNAISIASNPPYPSFLYNLNGQRVHQPKKGIYIKNGKKYLFIK